MESAQRAARRGPRVQCSRPSLSGRVGWRDCARTTAIAARLGPAPGAAAGPAVCGRIGGVRTADGGDPFHRGAFDAAAASRTAPAVAAYGIGLVGLAVKVLAPGYLAQQDAHPDAHRHAVLLLTQVLNALFVPWLACRRSRCRSVCRHGERRVAGLGPASARRLHAVGRWLALPPGWWWPRRRWGRACGCGRAVDCWLGPQRGHACRRPWLPPSWPPARSTLWSQRATGSRSEAAAAPPCLSLAGDAVPREL